METDQHKFSTGDKYEETLTSPRFNEETKASARPVVPLESTRGARGAIRRVRYLWPWGVLLTLAISVVVGIAASLIYRNSGASVPSATAPTVSETIIKAVPEPASLAPSNQTARVREPETQTTSRKRMEPQSVLTVSDEPEDRDRKEIERRDDDEEKISERARKEEKKRLKRLRKEAEELAEDERDSEDSDRPKARLVGVYTVKRKY
jgi:hypothetical protein